MLRLSVVVPLTNILPYFAVVLAPQKKNLLASKPETKPEDPNRSSRGLLHQRCCRGRGRGQGRTNTLRGQGRTNTVRDQPGDNLKENLSFLARVWSEDTN
jgi:hypothetical protein